MALVRGLVTARVLGGAIWGRVRAGRVRSYMTVTILSTPSRAWTAAMDDDGPAWRGPHANAFPSQMGELGVQIRHLSPYRDC